MSGEKVPPTLAVLDLLEFCHRVVAKPISRSFHSYYGHQHLVFDPEVGQQDFIDEVNRILARNGLAYELKADGTVSRLAPLVLRDALGSANFNTGDAELDTLLLASVGKYLDPDQAIRRESLEKLWDAWERLKTLDYPNDKKKSVQMLLKKATPQDELRAVLEKEAWEVTEIGNDFRIRHSEMTKIPIQRSDDIDYLFHRLFALIRLLLRATGRGK